MKTVSAISWTGVSQLPKAPNDIFDAASHASGSEKVCSENVLWHIGCILVQIDG